MWLEKEFWPINSQPKPPPFLIIPSLLGIVAATIDEQRKNKMILFTITNSLYLYLYSKTICNKTEQNVLSFQSLTFKHLGSIYLLNIIVLRNVGEAEKIGGLVSLTVIQFPF